MQYGIHEVLKMNYIDYHKPDTRKGELMKNERPLIDYSNYKRCDDDISAAAKLANASKYVGLFAVVAAFWFVILHLVLTVLEA